MCVNKSLWNNQVYVLNTDTISLIYLCLFYCSTIVRDMNMAIFVLFRLSLSWPCVRRMATALRYNIMAAEAIQWMWVETLLGWMEEQWRSGDNSNGLVVHLMILRQWMTMMVQLPAMY